MGDSGLVGGCSGYGVDEIKGAEDDVVLHNLVMVTCVARTGWVENFDGGMG